MGSIRQFSPGEYIPVVIGGSTSTTGGTTMGGAVSMTLQPDARQGMLVDGLWTLGSTLVVETVAIPDWANGFRLRPSSDVKFAIGEDPVAIGAETLTVGNTAVANEPEVRLLVAGTGRQLRLRTTVNAATCRVSFF